MTDSPHVRRRHVEQLLVRIQLIIKMILVDRPCAKGSLNSLFQVALYLPASYAGDTLSNIEGFGGRNRG